MCSAHDGVVKACGFVLEFSINNVCKYFLLFDLVSASVLQLAGLLFSDTFYC